MAVVTKPITVEVSKPNVFQAIAAKQNDSNSRFLKVTFVNEGEKINITPSAKVTINAERSDGQSQSFFGSVNSDGTATLPIHSWILELVGYVTCDVSIIEGNSKLTCTSFSLLVEEATHGSDDVSSDEQYDVLTDLIQSVNVLDDEMIAYTEATYTKIPRTDALEKRVDKNDKRITNLEQGITPSPFVTDETTAYQKNVPSNALPYAEVEKVGGMTRKSRNLIIPNSLGTGIDTSSGVNVKRGADGTSIILNGTSTQNEYVTTGSVELKNENYIIHGGSNECGVYVSGSTETNRGGITTIKDADKNASKAVGIYLVSGKTYNNFVVYPQIEIGTVATPYEPYFDGLRSAQGTEVESVGANMLGGEALADKIMGYASSSIKDETAKTIRYNAWEAEKINFYSNFKANTQYTIILKGYTFNGTNARAELNLRIRYTDDTQENLSWGNPAYQTPSIKAFVTKAGKSVKDMVGNYQIGATVLYYNECGIFEGVLSAEDFKPYVRNTLPIPEEVQSLDGYGWGINADCRNYIDFEKKQFVKQVGCVDLGTLEWVYQQSRFASGALPFEAKTRASGICSRYTVLQKHYLDMKDGTLVVRDYGWSSGNLCLVSDTAYTDAATFKSAMNGVMLYYELATPIITDISDILTDDNYIGVEGNGTITMVNENKFAVPSSITYQVKEGA